MDQGDDLENNLTKIFNDKLFILTADDISFVA